MCLCGSLSKPTNQTASQPASQSDRQTERPADRQSNRPTNSQPRQQAKQPDRTDTYNEPLHTMRCEEVAHALHVSQGVRGARLMLPLQTKRLHANIWINKRNAKMKIVYSKYHMFRQASGYFCGTALRPPSRHEAQLRIINARGAFGAAKKTCPLHSEECFSASQTASQPASRPAGQAAGCPDG